MREDGRDGLYTSLLRTQNRDGGWGYTGGSSWTEPTVYALLAQTARGQASESFERGVQWLKGLEQPDGGWAPHPSVPESTWVTALAVLLLATTKQAPGPSSPHIRWLIEQSGQESTFVFRLRQWLMGHKSDYEENPSGWCWFPGTAAWVIPTSLSILALQKTARQAPSSEIAARVESGRKFLLSRTCRDGGWNHGSSRALGYQAVSYPETTGIALLALHGVQSPKLTAALDCGASQFQNCRSPEGFNWLKLGLAAHGRTVERTERPPEPRHTPDVALAILSEAAAGGKNIFLE